MKKLIFFFERISSSLIKKPRFFVMTISDRDFAQNLFATHFVFPVTVLTTVLKIFGGLINSFKMFDSVASGNLEKNVIRNNLTWFISDTCRHAQKQSITEKPWCKCCY